MLRYFQRENPEQYVNMNFPYSEFPLLHDKRAEISKIFPCFFYMYPGEGIENI